MGSQSSEKAEVRDYPALKDRIIAERFPKNSFFKNELVVGDLLLKVSRSTDTRGRDTLKPISMYLFFNEDKQVIELLSLRSGEVIRISKLILYFFFGPRIMVANRIRK